MHLFLEHLVHHARVGFAVAGFHNLAYQETDGPVLARLKVGYGLGILGQDFVYDLADGAGVANLLQSQFLYQGLRCFASLLESTPLPIKSTRPARCSGLTLNLSMVMALLFR